MQDIVGQILDRREMGGNGPRMTRMGTDERGPGDDLGVPRTSRPCRGGKRFGGVVGSSGRMELRQMEAAFPGKMPGAHREMGRAEVGFVRAWWWACTFVAPSP